MTTEFQPLPAPGDIVWCHFPESVGTPGPKARPALVIAVSSFDHAVSIAYGTSQKTYNIYPKEFVLDPADSGFPASGLAVRTKFDLNNIVKVPFNSEWFSINRNVYASIPLPKIGILHPSYMPDALKANGQVP
jgi:mRNA-degrading endonuclease toxin of MazEF toxin-antitoxin module